MSKEFNFETMCLDPNIMNDWQKSNDNGTLEEIEKQEEGRYNIKDCKHPWDALQILATGEIRVCCWHSGTLGNFNSGHTIDGVWNGKDLEEVREYVKNNKVHPLCHKSPCKYLQKRQKFEE